MRIACLAWMLALGACARSPLDSTDPYAFDGGWSAGGNGSLDGSLQSTNSGGDNSGGGSQGTGTGDLSEAGLDARTGAGTTGGGNGNDDGGQTSNTTQGNDQDASACGSTDADLANCGECGNACPASATSCMNGLCQFGVACTWHRCVPSGAQPCFNEDDYLFCNSKPGQTWAAARSFCQALNMDLAVIDSPEEDAFVASYSLDNWIGCSDLDVEGDWRWIVPGGATNGTLFWKGTASGTAQGGQFVHWYSNIEPNAYMTDQNCGRMLSGAWWDEGCGGDKGLVCEPVRPL